ncbi:hypothetical protein ACHAXR_002545 [Thalassiosira sp. AJA248-18]
MSAADVTQCCAACGKGGDCLKACAACKLVKYCNVTCQKAHRPNHKKECKKRAAEISDEALFKTPPPSDDCHICYLRLPFDQSESRYQLCCGKIICLGCDYGDMIARASTEQICHFCRAPDATSHEEAIERLQKRIEAGDAIAMYHLGYEYLSGDSGVPQDSNKALELWHQAAKLGCAKSHTALAHSYAQGEGVEQDDKKAKYHWERAATGVCVLARHDLGAVEMNAGNMNKAMKHFMISAGCGCDDSLKEIQNGFSHGHVTKDDYENTLRAHKASTDEMQSDQRDVARRWLDEAKVRGM